MKKLFLFFLVLFSFQNFTSQDKVPNALLTSIQKKFGLINYLYADFSQRIISLNNFSKNDLSGKFYYKKDGSFRIELKNKILINDGKNIYNIDNKTSRVVISYADDASSAFSLEKIVFEYPKKCKIFSLEGNGEKILEMISRDNSLSFKKVFLYTHAENFPTKIKIIDLADNQTIIELKNVVINSPVPESKFTFTEKKGYEIIDLR